MQDDEYEAPLSPEWPTKWFQEEESSLFGVEREHSYVLLSIGEDCESNVYAEKWNSGPVMRSGSPYDHDHDYDGRKKKQN